MSDFWSNIVSGFWGSIVGIIIGAVITVIVTRIYYIKASRELKDEASELENLIKIIGRGLENAKLFKFKRNEKGKIVGLTAVRIGPQNVISEPSVSSPSIEKTDKSLRKGGD